MVWMEGLEPTSNGFVDRCLSVRTPTLIWSPYYDLNVDPTAPNGVLYQVELYGEKCRILIIPDTATGIAG